MNERSGSAPLMVTHQSSRTFAEASPVVAGYFTVWIVCGVTALVAAVILVFVPKTAFTDRTAEAEVAPAL